MRILAAFVCSVYYYSVASALPDGSDVGVGHSGPHVETSRPDSPTLVAPAPPMNSTWDSNGKGAALLNESSPLPTGSPKLKPAPKAAPPADPRLQLTPGRLTSGLGHTGDETLQSLPANAEPQPKPAALDAGQRHQTRDSTASAMPEIYNIPAANGPQPKGGKPAPSPAMAMVHSEAALDGPHTMQPGDQILTAGVDPFASNLVLGWGALAPGTPSISRVLATRVTPAVQGATFAAGGATYTASIDPNMNVVVGSSILKPGGAAATLGNGAAMISVMPGGALVVDGGTLTMSALRPPVTGCVVNINGHMVTARQTGTDGKVMVLSTATLTVGGPAATVAGQVVSFGSEGLRLGSVVAPISTMTPSMQAPSMPALAMPTLSVEQRVSGLARMSQASGSSSAKPTVTYLTVKSEAGANQFACVNGFILTLTVFLGSYFVGG